VVENARVCYLGEACTLQLSLLIQRGVGVPENDGISCGDDTGGYTTNLTEAWVGTHSEANLRCHQDKRCTNVRDIPNTACQHPSCINWRYCRQLKTAMRPHKLYWQIHPTENSNFATVAFSHQPVIEILDEDGTRVTLHDTLTVVLQKASGPGTLAGTLAVNATAGVATFGVASAADPFAALLVNSPGTYLLTATAYSPNTEAGYVMTVSSPHRINVS